MRPKTQTKTIHNEKYRLLDSTIKKYLNFLCLSFSTDADNFEVRFLSVFRCRILFDGCLVDNFVLGRNIFLTYIIIFTIIH